MLRALILIAVIISFSPIVYASNIDYYDRFLIGTGLEKGISYRSGDAKSTDLFTGLGFGYGIDDDKILNLDLFSDLDFENLIINPEFGLLLNEFSRVKFLMSIGPDATLRANFNVGLRSYEGVIFDILEHLAISAGVDTRLNLYKDVYFEFFANLSLIIKI